MYVELTFTTLMAALAFLDMCQRRNRDAYLVSRCLSVRVKED